ncbi:hypothetical protein TNCV_808871 [Trichonephila clavipes]|nr:hypothetical protein TNCV_808871 [Trichonephila clavipes]
MTDSQVMDTTEGMIILSDPKSVLEATIKREINVICTINSLFEQPHYKGKSCMLLWILAQVNIEGNEYVASLNKEPRDHDQSCTAITLDDRTAMAGSDVVQSGRPIFDDFFQHLWPYIGNNTANVVF